jgi:hypothetical protein
VDVFGCGGSEGGEVVLAGELGGARIEHVELNRVGPPEREPALERVRERGGEQPVAVGPRARVAPGVEALRRRLGGADDEVVPGQPVERPAEVVARLRAALGLEAHHLAERVDAGVGAPRDVEPDRLAEQGLERRSELRLDGAAARLHGPAGEVAAVVGEVEPERGQSVRKVTELAGVVGLGCVRYGPVTYEEENGMANTDVTQREGYERSTLSDTGAQIRHGSERGATIYVIIALIVGGVLCYGAVQTVEGWAQWLVLGVLIVFTGALAFAVGPNRRGAGQASTPESV